LFDRTTRETVWISQPLPGQTPDTSISATSPTISDDRNVILFAYSQALVENDFNNLIDVYAYDRSAGNYQRISLHASGNELNAFSSWPRISADGSRIVFYTYGNLLSNDDNQQLDIYMRTR
jgi:Tol biopolymer transport system component